MNLADRVAVITGAAQGIGAACARIFAEQGARVVIGDVNEVGAAALAKEIAAAGGYAMARRADVGARADCEALVEHAVSHFGRLDVLVNNAGIVHAADFLDLTEEDFDRVLRINLKGAFLCAQAAARQMIAQDARPDGNRGVIVNVSSVNAVLAIANQVPYTVSKGGLNQLTKVMALALAPRGVRVMGVGPGSIATEMLKTAVLTNEAARSRILSRTPLGRLGEPDEIARTVAFLASDDASYLTGTTLYPDGGRLALNYVM
ncbi:MAG TPA: SDR family NAD(P)-dependent oxidoreductase [Burkholderiaceae bacterium]|nr:SDR family NAD(P)-dependent oxidoreductase [Burkholderiaceae bacterium]HQR71795.1 SDR family NAD(P)-dependent oxidoreductase [Burkholderiaceae bacterium]